MRTIALFLTMAMVPVAAVCAEYLEQVESEVFEAKGTAKEIASRAKACIAQHLRNDEVRITDNAASAGPFPTSTVGSAGHSDGIEGGDVIVHADLEGGIVTANNRVDYKSKMLAHNVKSTLPSWRKREDSESAIPTSSTCRRVLGRCAIRAIRASVSGSGLVGKTQRSH